MLSSFDGNTTGIAVGILGIVVGLVVSVYLYLKGRRFADLTCTFNKPVIVALQTEAIRGEAANKLSVFFGEERLRQLSVLQATIRNTGTEPIIATQIERPITFHFPSDIEVIEVDIVDSSPNVKVELVQPEDQKALSNGQTMSWTLQSLDRDEFFDLQFIINGTMQHNPMVDARILGLHKGITIRSYVEELQFRKFLWAGFAVSAASLVSGTLFGFVASKQLDVTFESGSNIFLTRQLFSLAEEDGYRFAFMPETLADSVVCEQVFIEGTDFGDVALKLLRSYPDCFLIRRAGERYYEISSNSKSGSIFSSDNRFYCKCTEESIQNLRQRRAVGSAPAVIE